MQPTKKEVIDMGEDKQHSQDEDKEELNQSGTKGGAAGMDDTMDEENNNMTPDTGMDEPMGVVDYEETEEDDLLEPTQ